LARASARRWALVSVAVSVCGSSVAVSVRESGLLSWAIGSSAHELVLR
jgi:hypothetical protein